LDFTYAEFVLPNNDEINEAFDRGVTGVFEFVGGREVVVFELVE